MQQNLNKIHLISSAVYRYLYTKKITLWTIVKYASATVVSLWVLIKIWKFRLREQKQRRIHKPVKGVLLRDGRWICYEEYGKLDSEKVVFFCHSLGSSRLEKHPNDLIPKRIGVRIISIDRPGYGQSMTHENRTYLSFADDIYQIADALGVTKFAVCGVNSGAPYALACAYMNDKLINDSVMSKRLVCVSAISSEVPYNELPQNEFSSFQKDMWFLNKYLPFLLKFFLHIELYKSIFANPEKYSSSILKGKNKFYPSDGEELNDWLRVCVEFMREGLYENGVQEVVRELSMERSDWGFKLSEISKTPVYFWHGKKNKLIPIKLIKMVAKKIPTAIVHEIPKKGHLIMMNDEIWTQILTSIARHFDKFLEF